jgi:hypothetical protein
MNTKQLKSSIIKFGFNVRPWKRAVMWVCITISCICFAILANISHHPLFLLIPAASIMCGLEYIRCTET